MEKIISSGNAIVDAMGKINIVGNLLPLSWLREITFDNGHADFAGAVILADLVYWYRPSVIHDPETGSIRWKKKFKSDLVQLGYAEIQKRFNLSCNQAKDAMRRLEKRGLIQRHLRTITVGGTRCNNALFIEIKPERIAEITYSIFENENENEGVCGYIQIPEGIYPHRSEDESTEVDVSISTAVGIESLTNTKNKKENTKKDYSSITQTKEKFKEQIGYEYLMIDYPRCKEQINEIVDIATEVLTSEREFISVNREERPAEYVKDRFLRLDMSSMDYILASLKEHKNGVTNVRAFLITTLFNAASTIENYTGVKVNHDLAVMA